MAVQCSRLSVLLIYLTLQFSARLSDQPLNLYTLNLPSTRTCTQISGLMRILQMTHGFRIMLICFWTQVPRTEFRIQVPDKLYQVLINLINS